MTALIKRRAEWIFGGVIFIAAVDYLVWTSHDLVYQASAIVVETVALSVLVGYGLRRLSWLDRPLPRPLKWVLALVGVGVIVWIGLALAGTVLLAQSALND